MAALQSACETGTVSTHQYIPPYLSQIISNKTQQQCNVRINLLVASVVLIDVERLETLWGVLAEQNVCGVTNIWTGGVSRNSSWHLTTLL